MTPTPPTNADALRCESESDALSGERVALCGRFASVGRREVAAAVERRGARLDDAAPTVVVLGEDATDAERAAAAELADAAGAERIFESDLWRRLGLVEHAAGVARLYTPSMVADLADVPLSAIRRWVRRGALRPACRVKHLAYFALDEVRVARLLSRLLRDGRSLASIDHAIDAARREAAAVGCPLSALSLAVVDGRLIVHRQDGVAEAGGQRRLDFADGEADAAEVVAVLPLTPAGPPDSPRDRAWALSEAGEPHAAIEALRLAMLESRPTAEDHFTLGDWLYELGDTPAARERYYAALELEPEHSEARLNLGCLFVDAGEIDLAIAAFRGVLDQHENLADAHYHLARLLEERGDSSAASDHWRRLLDLAPDGPWADDARASIRLV